MKGKGDSVMVNRNLERRLNPPVRRGVIGILRRGDELLMIRRAECVPKGGTWCFPGGHVEAGETPRQALCRELREELGIEVRPTRRLGAVRVLDSRHILVAWEFEHLAGEFRPAEHEIAEFAWMTALEVRNLTRGLPSNEHVLQLMEL